MPCRRRSQIPWISMTRSVWVSASMHASRRTKLAIRLQRSCPASLYDMHRPWNTSIPGDRGHAARQPPSDLGSSGRLCATPTLHRRLLAAHRHTAAASAHLGTVEDQSSVCCTMVLYMDDVIVTVVHKSDAHHSMHSNALKHFSQSLASFNHHHKARQTFFPLRTLRFWPSPYSCEEKEISKRKSPAQLTTGPP
jgi:hypothetical protein